MYYKGQCKTHIRRQEGSGEHRRTVTHTSTEQYFDYKVIHQNVNPERFLFFMKNFFGVIS